LRLGARTVTDSSRYPPPPYSVKKILVFNRIQRWFRSKFFILIELFADSRFQRSCGVFSGGCEPLAARRGISLLILYRLCGNGGILSANSSQKLSTRDGLTKCLNLSPDGLFSWGCLRMTFNELENKRSNRVFLVWRILKLRERSRGGLI
jgi:hypothetical protein